MGKEKKFVELLQKTCLKCTKSTLKTYLQSIRRLYRLENEGDVPLNSKWLKSDSLFKKYKKLPLKVRRHLSTGAWKALKSYGEDNKKWYKTFIDDQNQYSEERAKHKKSDTEKEKWTSVKQLKKAATDLKRRFRHILEQKPTLSNLYKLQWWLVIKMFTQVPTRNDTGTIELSKSKGNWLERPKRGNFILHFNQYKNSNKMGPKTIKLSRSISMAIRKFLKYRDGVEVKHNFLLTGLNNKPMSRSGFGKAFRNQTFALLGKKIGSRIIRVVVATENRKLLEKAAELSNKMLHSTKQTIQYTRKDD